jgi:SMI1-KNR4 cell-wall
MQHLFDAIIEKTTSYPKVKSSNAEIENFKFEVLNRFNIKLDDSYLNFLLHFDGFCYNGNNFYGTKRHDDVYVLSAIDVTETWRGVSPIFANYFIIGETDMDFYCFNDKSNSYHEIGKGDSIIWSSFTSLAELLEYALYRYD